MYLLISSGGQVLGQTFSQINAERHAIVSRDPLTVIGRRGDIERLPLPIQNRLLEDYDADNVAKLWNILKKRTESTKDRFPYWGKVSVQRVLRHLFRDVDSDVAYSKQALLEMIPGASWISITTAFTMLKNKKYSRGKTMSIGFKKGKYRRQD
jgi:hypothetical protein